MSQEPEQATTSPQKDSPSRAQQHHVDSQADSGSNGDAQPLEFGSSASSTHTETGECEFLLPEAAKIVVEADISHVVQEKGDEGDTCLLSLSHNEPSVKPSSPVHNAEADHGDSLVVANTSSATVVPHLETRSPAVTTDGIPDKLERCDSISTVYDYLTPNGSEMSITDDPLELANLSGGTHSFVVQGALDDDVADVFSSSLEVFPPNKQHVEDTPPPFVSMLETSLESLQSRTPTPPKAEDPPQILDVTVAEATVEDCTYPAVHSPLNATITEEVVEKCTTPDAPYLLNVTIAETTIENGMHPDTQSQLNVSNEDTDESLDIEQTATILDVSDQRVNFMNTPSSLSPMSSHAGSLEVELGYQRIGNARSTSSTSSTASSCSRSTGSNVSRLDVPVEHADALPTPSCHSPQPHNDAAITSITKLLPSSSSSIEVEHAKSKTNRRRIRRLFSWVKFKAMVERRFSSIAGRFKHKDAGMKKGFFSPSAQRVNNRRLFEEALDDDPEVFGEGRRMQPGGRMAPRLRLDSDGDEPLEDLNNEASDRFYSTSRMQWNVREMYQRAASYVHSIWSRGS